MIDTILNISPFGALVGILLYAWLSRDEKARLLRANETVMNQWIADKDRWNEERQQLLDRIQAPSFAEYKTQEVRIIKAHNNEKEPPKLEQL